MCSDYERCQHCNYMAHGFQCDHGNGSCVLTDMEEINGRRRILVQSIAEKNNIPELGTVTVEFPIPEAQYEETIRALNGIESGAVVEQDCFVADIGTADCPALERLIGTMANVDELDWLGKQLESFDRYELLQFNAAVERFGLSAADELIDLSFCAREVTVVSDFTDLEKTGKRHYLTVHGACDPKELENLDG